MSNQALVEITGTPQVTVEVVAGSPPVVEVTAPATPLAIEVAVPGPQGPSGPTGAPGPTGSPGIVSAVAPLNYDSVNKALSIDSSVYATAAQGTKADTALQPDDLNTALVDTTTTPSTIYVGKAPQGTSPSAALWTIIRSTYNAAGVRTAKGTAANATWTGRAGHSYS